MFRIKNFVGFVDLVGFYQQYKNFVEFYAGFWGDLDQSIFTRYGFKFINTGNSRVYGVEATLAGGGKIHKNVELQILAGYTFSRPQTLSKDKVLDSFQLYKNVDPVIVSYAATTIGKSDQNILKYRIEHLGKFDAEILLTDFKSKVGKVFNGFSVGSSVRYYSGMRSIDKFFVDFDKPNAFPTGIKNFVEKNNGKFSSDAVIFDLRVGYELKKHFRFGVIMNNVLNKAYTLRPITPEPPRTTSLQVVYKI